MGFDVRDSDLPLRVAWPLFVLDCIDWFTDEDAQYLSSLRTGEVWRLPVGATASQATVKLPGGLSQSVPVHEGRAVLLGERSGFYELTAGGETSTFAANLLDASESAIAPHDNVLVAGREAGAVEGFHAGVRREIWIYLLLAAALLSALEWATYHRRVTV